MDLTLGHRYQKSEINIFTSCIHKRLLNVSKRSSNPVGRARVFFSEVGSLDLTWLLDLC